MSKRKLLIDEVFKQGERESGKDAKSGIAAYLWSYFDDHFSPSISDKTFIRYYDAFIRDNKEINIDSDTLNKLSQYLGYKDFSDFSRTFVKKEDDANKTTVKISVDENDTSLTDKIINIFITNEQNFKMPEFMKQNGFGIVELVFVLLLITGTSSFGSDSFGKDKNTTRLSIFGGSEVVKKKECMYWGGEEYKLAYCDDKDPQHNVIPLDTLQLKYFKKITRPDTLTAENSMGIVWYDKSNNNVEFFTNHGKHPENEKALKDVTERILDNYAGIETE